MFDITKHKFMDSGGATKLGWERDELWLEVDKDATLLGLSKQDVIVIAKHLELTPHDIGYVTMPSTFDVKLNNVNFGEVSEHFKQEAN